MRDDQITRRARLAAAILAGCTTLPAPLSALWRWDGRGRPGPTSTGSRLQGGQLVLWRCAVAAWQGHDWPSFDEIRRLDANLARHVLEAQRLLLADDAVKVERWARIQIERQERRDLAFTRDAAGQGCG